MSVWGYLTLAFAIWGFGGCLGATMFFFSMIYRELADARAERRRIKPPPRQPRTDLRVRFPAKGR